jgi:hypothetical protein
MGALVGDCCFSDASAQPAFPLTPATTYGTHRANRYSWLSKHLPIEMGCRNDHLSHQAFSG